MKLLDAALFCIALLVLVRLIHFARSGAAILPTCQMLLSRLHSNLASDVDDFLDLPPAALDWRDLWKRSGGTLGMYKRWRNRVPLVQLCQLKAREAAISDAEYLYVLRKSDRLGPALLKSMLARALAPVAPRFASRVIQEALREYCELAYRTHAYFSDDSAPLCARLLASVL